MIDPSKESYFSFLSTMSNMGVVIHDPRGKVLYLNEFANTYFQVTTNSGNQMNLAAEFIDAEGHKIADEEHPFSKVLREKKGFRGYKLGIITPEGQTRSVEFDGEPFFDDNGAITQIAIAFRDSTELADQVAELETYKRRSELSQKVAKIGTWEFSLINNHIDWTPEVFRIYDIPATDEAPNFDSFMSLLSEKDRNHLASCIDRAIVHGESYDVRQEITTRTGEKRIIRGYGQPMKDHHGRITSLVGTVKDITEVEKSDAELKTLALIAKKSDNIIVITDAKGSIEWVNDGFVKLTGYNLAEVIGKKPGHILQGEDTDPLVVETMRQAIQNQESITTELLNYSKTGEPYWLHINIQPIFDQHGHLNKFVAIELNLTERKNAEAKINELMNQLNLSLAAKNRFFSIIAHDLRTPFNGLLSLSDLLLDDREEMTPDEIREIISAVDKQARGTFNLLENLLTWSKSEIGALRCNPVDADLKEILQSIHDNLHRSAALKEIRLVIDAPYQGDCRAYLDPNMMGSVFQNILSNAIKFSPSGTDINLLLEDLDDQYFQVSIKDHGVGMSQQAVDDLFQIDKISSTEGTQGESGSGLGLILVGEFVRQNHGEISCDSAPGQGTLFRIKLPKKEFAATLFRDAA